jgi:hypothetical protein
MQVKQVQRLEVLLEQPVAAAESMYIAFHRSRSQIALLQRQQP